MAYLATLCVRSPGSELGFPIIWHLDFVTMFINAGYIWRFVSNIATRGLEGLLTPDFHVLDQYAHYTRFTFSFLRFKVSPLLRTPVGYIYFKMGV